MTTGQIDQVFREQFDASVKQAYQRKGCLLRNAVYEKTDIGASAIQFAKLGKSTASIKYRHADMALDNIQHTPTVATMADYTSSDYFDQLDEVKTNIPFRAAYAESKAWAIGRQMDSLIIAAADAAVVATGFVTSVTLTSYATVRQSFLTAWETMAKRDVMMDDQVFCVLGPAEFSLLMNLQEFSNSQWVGDSGMTFPTARKTSWMGMNFIEHTGLTNTTGTTYRCFLWHKRALGFGVAKDINGEVWYDGNKRSYRISAAMSSGAVAIDTDGIQGITLDEAATRPTS